MSAFTVDYELPVEDRFDEWGTVNSGAGTSRRRYRIVGIRIKHETPVRGTRWVWLGYPCRADGEALKGGRVIEPPVNSRPNPATRNKVLRDLRGDLNRFDLETARP